MKAFFIIFILLFSSQIYAQLDSPTGTVELKGLEPIEADLDIETDLNFSASKKHSLSNLNFGFVPRLSERNFSDQESKQINMKTKDAGFEKYVSDVQPRHLEYEREMKEQYQKDQYLGDIKTTSRTVTVMYRDHEYVDGDKVRIYVNDKMMRGSVLLSGNWKGFTYELNTGVNRFEFEALNMGTSAPNTAALQVTGDDGSVLALYHWNLTTGNKGTMIVMKEK